MHYQGRQHGVGAAEFRDVTPLSEAVGYGAVDDIAHNACVIYCVLHAERAKEREIERHKHTHDICRAQDFSTLLVR